MKSGIYKITNIKNNNFYIGSAINIDNRIRSHKSTLSKNKHHNIRLQNAYNKYGIKYFLFEIIEYCDNLHLLVREQHYLDILNPHYNIAKNASAPMSNRKHSKKTLAKFKGRIAWNKGIPRTTEEKQLMSKNRKGIPCPEYLKERFRNNTGYWLGKNISDETKLKISMNCQKDKLECSNGKIYKSQLDAAINLKIRQGHISEHLQGKRPNVKGYKFKKIT